MKKVSLLFALVLLAATPLAAQNTDIEALSGLQFNFGNPGARSLGMGGAFLALADDASAAEANPAGLTILRRMEVSIEARNWETIESFNASGEFPELEQAQINSFSRRAPITFGSVVLPVGENFSLAGYYHAPLDHENVITNIFGIDDGRGNFQVVPITFFMGPQGPVTRQECIGLGNQCSQFNLLPFETAVDIKLKTWGLAGAWKFGSLSLGVGGRYHEFSQISATTRTDTDLIPQFLVAQEADDTDITLSAGFKWALGERLSLGGVYKQGAEFETNLFAIDFTGNDFDPVDIGGSNFHIPDSMGLGISFRPIPVLTINADAIRVGYSNLTDDFQTVLNLTPEEVEGFESDDVTEIHVGAEYFFATRVPFAIRGGWWRDPAHGIEYRGNLRSTASVAAAILYPEREDQDHYTIGVGVAWPRFQIDAAYDTSDVVKVGSLSAVFRF